MIYIFKIEGWCWQVVVIQCNLFISISVALVMDFWPGFFMYYRLNIGTWLYMPHLQLIFVKLTFEWLIINMWLPFALFYYFLLPIYFGVIWVMISNPRLIQGIFIGCSSNHLSHDNLTGSQISCTTKMLWKGN